MQEQRYLGRLEPGMDVCDMDGTKFGTVNHVFRTQLAEVGASTAGIAESMPREDVLEVKTGLFGLGKHLYVPFSAIQDVTSGCVFINQPKDRIEGQGWDVRPDYLEGTS